MALRATHAAAPSGSLRCGDTDPGPTMKILFFGRRFTYFRNFDSVLRELAGRGHTMHLAVERETEEGRALIDSLTSQSPGITVGIAPEREADDWTWLAGRLRHGLE